MTLELLANDAARAREVLQTSQPYEYSHVLSMRTTRIHRSSTIKVVGYVSLCALILAGGWATWRRFGPVPPPPSLGAQRTPTATEWEEAKKAAAANPKDARAQLKLAGLQAQHEGPQTALPTLLAAAELPQAAGDVSLMLAEVTRDGIYSDEALPGAQAAVAANPADPRTWEGLVRILYRLGRRGQAEAALQEANRRFPHEKRLMVLRAESLQASGRLKEAVKVYEAALRIQPDAEAETALGILLARLEGRKAAKQAFQSALNLDPGSVVPYLGLAKVNLELGLAKEAEEAAYGALQVAPENPEALYLVARVLAAKGDPESSRTSIEMLRRVLALQPSHLEARFQLGAVLVRSGNARAALREFEAVLNAQPHRLDARQGYAQALDQAGQKEQANEQKQVAGQLAELEQRRFQLAARVTRSPRDTAARCALAEFYAANGAKDMALREFDKALEIEPKNARALSGRSRVLGGSQ